MKNNISRFLTIGNAQPIPSTHPHILSFGHVMPGITKQEFSQRRSNLLGILGSTNPSQISIHSNPLKYATGAVFYPYQQNTNMLYLTGYDEPDAILVMNTNNGTSTLYCNQQISNDREFSLFSGASLGSERAVTELGLDISHPLSSLPDSLHISNENNRRDIMLNVENIIERQRVIKSEGEIELMKMAAKCSEIGFKHAMALTKPGMTEQHIGTIIEYHAKMNGADGLAFCPVVANGRNALVLHYVRNKHLLRTGDLVLIDAGAIYSHYRSDVSRTWPVSAKFTLAQRDLYQLVYNTQRECIKLCRQDKKSSLVDLYWFMIHYLHQGMIDLGFRVTPKEVQSIYCPHDVGHHLGLDLHDCPKVDKQLALQAGNVITIEPGLYIPDGDSKCPVHFHGMGIRIEDDILITKSDPIILTSNIPVTIDDIESACKGIE